MKHTITKIKKSPPEFRQSNLYNERKENEIVVIAIVGVKEEPRENKSRGGRWNLNINNISRGY